MEIITRCYCLTRLLITFSLAWTPCLKKPCRNGGICVPLYHDDDHKCVCKTGFTGKNCETNINDCSPNPCANEATCRDLVNNYTCTCAVGFYGRNCTINPDACSSNPCVHGGTCTDGLDDYTCACPVGYAGKRCGHNPDDCSSNPCANGGTCTDGLSDFTCACVVGYEGKDCSVNPDDCASNPCVNGGTCVDRLNDYICACPIGYEGKDCSVNPDACSSNPCAHGGVCTDELDDYTCACPVGYAGKTCGQNPDDCFPYPCLNGGTCSDGLNDFTCACVVGYEGKDCSVDTDDCAPNPCLNDGTCTDGLNSYTCACAVGFEGNDCSINLDDCSPSLCANGGTCIDGANDYTCACTTEYGGKNCTLRCNSADGWEGFMDHCYKYIEELKDWFNAKTDCVALGSFLVTVHSDEERDFVVSLIPAGEGGTWMGANDDATENVWVWEDEKPWGDYTAWNSGEPSNYNGNGKPENCMSVIKNGKPGLWNDACCNQTRSSICKKDPTDYCFPKPCLNGGTCINGLDDYTCACPVGYAGKRCGNICDLNDGWVRLDSSCYKYVSTQSNMSDARTHCSNLQNSLLLTIHSQAENDFARSLIPADGDCIWVGANDIDTEGVWVWEDGKPWGTYTAWNDVEPNGDRNENCITMYTNGLWVDIACSNMHYFICKK